MLFRFYWSECRDSNLKQSTLRAIARQIEIQEASSSNATFQKNKTERANALSVLLVRVSRFELEAS